MDLKEEDILNIEIDPEFLLCSELDKLSLETIPKDIFIELSEEIIAGDKPDILSPFLLAKSDKATTTEDSNVDYNSKNVKNEDLAKDELSIFKCKVDQEVKNKKNKEKDVNGNEEIPSSQNLNELLKLELSDSENDEECEKIEELRERGGPSKSRKQYSRQKGNLYSRKKEYDKSQFNSEKLRFLSGSSQVDLSNTTLAGPSNVFYNNFSPLIHNTDFSSYSISNNEKSYEDSRANSVNSPESGYETSGSSPPPNFSVSINNSSFDLGLDLDDKTVIDTVVALENSTDSSDYVFPVFNLLSSAIDEKDYVGKLVDYLKDTSDIQSELLNANTSLNTSFTNEEAASSNCADLNSLKEFISNQTPPKKSCEKDSVEKYFLTSSSYLQNDISSVRYPEKVVPITNGIDSNNILSVKTPSSSANIQQELGVYKNISPKPLETKARDDLRKLLIPDVYSAAENRILRKILEDKQKNKDFKIIYIEDEGDKTSDNRTNLHMAVLNHKLEEIFALVEFHEHYNKPLNDLNNRDKYGKTALDYAIQNNMLPVVKYLQEKKACRSVNI